MAVFLNRCDAVNKTCIIVLYCFVGSQLPYVKNHCYRRWSFSQKCARKYCYLTNGLPVGCIFPKQQADGFQSQLDNGRRVAHRSDFDLRFEKKAGNLGLFSRFRMIAEFLDFITFGTKMDQILHHKPKMGRKCSIFFRITKCCFLIDLTACCASMTAGSTLSRSAMTSVFLVAISTFWISNNFWIS